MATLAVLLALFVLIFTAYRGASVILLAPLAALIGVALSEPSVILPVYSALFMSKLAEFVQKYFPLFLLGAVFGKGVEVAGFSRVIARALIKWLGPSRAMLAIVLVCNVLTYGGVSVFVVVFAAYPFAAFGFRAGGIPKRFIPATIAFGALTYTMDCLPGTPQIQNLIPAPFFGTDAYAAGTLGVIGAVFIFTAGSFYLSRRIHEAMARGEGYGSDHRNEPMVVLENERDAPVAIALMPLIVVGVVNKLLTFELPHFYNSAIALALPGLSKPVVVQLAEVKASWALLIALLCGIISVGVLAPRAMRRGFGAGARDAVNGALLAVMNTASEFGFGAVMAALPGFLVIKEALKAIPNPLVNEAISVTTLAGVTGSASGGLSIALAALAGQFKAAGTAAGIPMEVLHRVASMASGGMDTLPHNGAVIVILAVCGLTHRESYADIFVISLIKTAAVFAVIGVYYATGLV